MQFSELLADLIYRVQVFTISAIVLVLAVAGLAGVFFLILLWYKYRDREERSLEYVLLQVLVPRDNEIKIDAAEQMFASLSSLHKSGWFAYLKPQIHVSFEIVATPGEINFYVSVPAKVRDMVEKMIYGAYPGADILTVDEYNIFSE